MAPFHGRNALSTKRRVLIVKIGALGDVVRTTPLLRALKAEVYWITSREALGILPRRALAGVCELDSWRQFAGLSFDAVFSLEENAVAAAVAAGFPTRRFIGVKPADNGRLVYTKSSAPWFDMGLISRLGRRRADALKKKNRKSYQEILFAMAGLPFRGEEYWIARGNLLPASDAKRRGGVRVGLEPRVGDRWPGKAWRGYSELARRLRRAGAAVKILRQRRSLAGYVSDIAGCDAVVSGDTLAMHLALALGKPTAAIFLCTSPWEIHGYDRLEKIVGPRLLRDFYKRDLSPGAAPAAGGEVWAALKRLIGPRLKAPMRHAARSRGRTP
ncbi:MAG TPA: glycosyltransferase family 9 protein [Elusimicrobiota bacterium]|nr:glycosyltransferase family 9 protein [Elusimicrobiota bacterium]